MELIAIGLLLVFVGFVIGLGFIIQGAMDLKAIKRIMEREEKDGYRFR